MTKGNSKGKKRTAPKPAKKKRPLTASKKVVESNKRLLSHFDSLTKGIRDECNEKLVAMGNTVDGINKAHDQMWNNQRVMHTGLKASEEHTMLVRRVLNDALGGVTRVVKIERRIEAGKPEMEEVQLIDWDWYAEQFDYSDDPNEFMAGTIVPDEAIEIKKEARRVAAEKHAEEIYKKNLESLDKSTTAVLSKHAEKFHPLLEDDEKFREGVKEIYPNLDEKLLEAACGMIRNKLENAPSQEEMEAEAAALSDKMKRVTEEAIKRENGEPYDEELLAEADAEIAKMEAEEANTHPEGAAIFGGS